MKEKKSKKPFRRLDTQKLKSNQIDEFRVGHVRRTLYLRHKIKILAY